MLHILLTILAVIGKILLGILGFIFLLLLLILLVPIRYKGNFRKQGKEMEARASVSWLLKFLQVQVSWIGKKLSFEIRILGIPLLRLLKWIKGRKKSSGKKKAKKKDKETTSETDDSELLLLPDQEAEEKRGEPEEENNADLRAEAAEPEADNNADASAEAAGQPESTENTLHSEEQAEAAESGEPVTVKVSPIRKIADTIEKILGIPKKLADKVKSILEKVKGIFSKLEDLKKKITWVLDLLRTEMFREVLNCVKKELLAIVRHILPQKLWGELEYGLGDPASTGEVLVGLSIVYPVLPKKLVICPNFEEQILEGDLSLKGRIRLVVLLFHGVKVILNKEVRRLIKKVRHKEA